MSQASLNIGCTPADEPCVQVGHKAYARVARAECRLFAADLSNQIAKKWNNDIRIHLRTVGSPHDFGTYYEVFADYDPNDAISVAQALFCEGEADENWSKPAKKEITELYRQFGIDFDHPDE